MTLNEHRSVFIYKPRCCCFPRALNHAKRRLIGVYFSGILFTLGWWIFVDGIITSARIPENPAPPGFEDWASGIVVTLGMAIAHSIDLESLKSDGDGYMYDDSDSRVWFCRLMMFLGCTMLAGGLVGSVVVLVFKYVLHELSALDSYLGICQVIQCSLILISTLLLWAVPRKSEDYMSM